MGPSTVPKGYPNLATGDRGTVRPPAEVRLPNTQAQAPSAGYCSRCSW